jgi:putative ABC transport system substrate-binding protein
MSTELMPKRLELVSELVPQAAVIALLVNPNNPIAERIMRDVQEAARAKGVQLQILKAGTEGEFNATFETLVKLPAGALVLSADPSLAPDASRWWHWRHTMPFRRSTSGASSPSSAA